MQRLYIEGRDDFSVQMQPLHSRFYLWPITTTLKRKAKLLLSQDTNKH